MAGAVISLDDGTSSGRLILSGPAAPYLDLVEVGDPLDVVGLVEIDASGPYLLVTDPDGVARAGDPNAAAQEPASGDPSAGASPATAGVAAAGPASSEPGPIVGAPGSPGATAGSIGPLAELGLVLLGALAAIAVVLPFVRRGVRFGRSASSAVHGPAAPDPGADGS